MTLSGIGGVDETDGEGGERRRRLEVELRDRVREMREKVLKGHTFFQ